MTISRPAWALMLAASAMPSPGFAQARVGPEFQVNASDNFYTGDPHVAGHTDGSFVVVWTTRESYEIPHAIHGRRYNAAGLAQGSEFQVGVQTTGFMFYPSIAIEPTGGFVVVWQAFDGDYHGIFGRRFDAQGTPQGNPFQELQVSSYTTEGQGHPSVAADPSGNFVVVWESAYQDGSGWGVFGQRYDAGGVRRGGEFLVNVITTTGNQRHPSVAAAGAGRFAVVWEGPGADGTSDVFGQFYDSSGLPSGDLRLNAYTTNAQSFPDIAADASGNFTVVWQGDDDSGRGVFGRRFTPSGVPLGAEFRVNTYTTGHQTLPAVSASADGFVVVWTSEGEDGSGHGVFAQRYDASGGVVNVPFQVNTYTTDSQRAPSVTSEVEGTFVVVWTSPAPDGTADGIFGQRMGPDLIFRDGFEFMFIPP